MDRRTIAPRTPRLPSRRLLVGLILVASAAVSGCREQAGAQDLWLDSAGVLHVAPSGCRQVEVTSAVVSLVDIGLDVDDDPAKSFPVIWSSDERIEVDVLGVPLVALDDLADEAGDHGGLTDDRRIIVNTSMGGTTASIADLKRHPDAYFDGSTYQDVDSRQGSICGN